MIRSGIFIIGLLMLLVGGAANYPQIPLPFDSTEITFTLGTVVLSLNIVLVVGGVFLIIVAWVFHKLAQP
ncbi:MAG: hypothetical protein O7D32_02045 [bacterium]|nr:hypothetical protein [bacterium]